MSEWSENGDHYTLVRGLDGVTFAGSGGVSTFKIIIHPPEWNRLMEIVQRWQNDKRPHQRELESYLVTDPGWVCKAIFSTSQFEWAIGIFKFRVGMSNFMTAHLKETYRKTTKLELLLAQG